MAYSNASLADAYLSIYEDKAEVEELGYSIIENAAYVLFSQGYTVEDLCDYFEEANTNVISEDFLSFAEGKSYLSESFVVSDAFIDEQYEQLNEILGALVKGAKALARPVAGLAGKALNKVGGAASKLGKAATNKSIPKAGKQLELPLNKPAPVAAKPGLLQKAGNFAKGLMSKAKNVVKKIPGAGAAAKLAKGPVGKIASRVAPGLGVAAYGVDAASRFKKGDWGGGLLSTAGAALSAVPGAGTLASLAPAAIQMGTDALGLTGDKSRKAKPAATPPKTPPAPAATKPVAPSKSTAPTKTSPASASTADKIKLGTQTYKQQVKSGDVKGAEKTGKDVWALANPQLAKADKLRQSGAPRAEVNKSLYNKGTAASTGAGQSQMQKDAEELRGMTNRSLQRQGKPMGGPQGPGSVDKGDVQASIKAAQKREKEKAAASAGVVKSSYEFDMVLNHLLENNYASTEEQAHAIMAHMSEGWKNAIMIEGYQRNPEKGEMPDRSREAIPGQAPRGMPPRGNADREAFEKWYRLQQASKKGKATAKA